MLFTPGKSQSITFALTIYTSPPFSSGENLFTYLIKKIRKHFFFRGKTLYVLTAENIQHRKIQNERLQFLYLEITVEAFGGSAS